MHLEGIQSPIRFGAFARACFFVRKRPSILPLMRSSQGFNFSVKDFSVVILVVIFVIDLLVLLKSETPSMQLNQRRSSILVKSTPLDGMDGE